MSVPALPIIVDDREKRGGWKLDGFTSIFKRLETGDYSLVGYESRVCIERKSHSDAYSSVSDKKRDDGRRTNRERLEDEFKRMAEMERAIVIIEANMDDFMVPPPHSKMHPSSVVGTYLSWMVKYNVMVEWMPNKEYAERLAIRFLGAYIKYRVRGDGV